MATGKEIKSEAQMMQSEMLEKVRGIHSTAYEIKKALAETHKLTKEIHEHLIKKP